MKEMLDVFDSKMNKIGVEEREKVHKKGLWHQTIHCWIIKKVGGKKYIVVQKRDKKKKVAPNYLDITAAGHLHAGETPVDGIREIEEELGIIVEPKNFISLGIRISASDSKTKINKEFCHVYFLENDLPLNKYKMQKEEVSGLVEIEINDGLNLFTGDVDSVKCNSIFFENDELVEKVVEVRVEDFIPRIEAYYLKVFIMAERYFEGKKALAI